MTGSATYRAGNVRRAHRAHAPCAAHSVEIELLDEVFVEMRAPDNFIHVRGARVHNLKNVNVDIPRDTLVVFTGISGSGKSSLAFGTLYAEAQRRYFESVSPYARRLIDQVAVPDVDSIEGLPPAVALQQQRGATSSRSSVGSISTLSNLLRMLYSRVGDYPRGQPMLHAEDFSPNTPQGACAELSRPRSCLRCHRGGHGAGYFFEYSRARHRRLAACMARAKPARHLGDPGIRRRYPLAQTAEERPQLDPLHG